MSLRPGHLHRDAHQPDAHHRDAHHRDAHQPDAQLQPDAQAQLEAQRERKARRLARLAELTEELLDAHCDTVCLADTPPSSVEWQVHVEYLKDLQRVGHRALAELIAS